MTRSLQYSPSRNEIRRVGVGGRSGMRNQPAKKKVPIKAKINETAPEIDFIIPRLVSVYVDSDLSYSLGLLRYESSNSYAKAMHNKPATMHTAHGLSR